MALWTGFPAGVGVKAKEEPYLLPRRPLSCRAKSDDFGRKLSCRFILPDEVLPHETLSSKPQLTLVDPKQCFRGQFLSVNPAEHSVRDSLGSIRQLSPRAIADLPRTDLQSNGPSRSKHPTQPLLHVRQIRRLPTRRRLRRPRTHDPAKTLDAH